MTLFLCFFILSFFGYVLETVFSLVKTGKYELRKTMKYLPLCPVYGIAGVFLIILKPYLNGSLLLYFVIGGLISTTVEYYFNYFSKKYFSLSFWDYSSAKYNLNGNICLSFSIIWAFLSMFFLLGSTEFYNFCYLFPSVVKYFLIFGFVLDLTETLYLFKHYEINHIKGYCGSIKNTEV